MTPAVDNVYDIVNRYHIRGHSVWGSDDVITQTTTSLSVKFESLNKQKGELQSRITHLKGTGFCHL